jgi:hypothetical protein
MKLALSSLSVLALLATTSCEAVTGVAPADTPRVEAELVVNIETDFLAALVDVGPDSDLVGELHEAVRAQADLGLRFYATPTESYGEDDVRPAYLMTVTIDSLEVVLEHDMIEEEDQEPRIETTVDDLVCQVSAKLERRRENAPSLLIAAATESRQINAEKNSDDLAAEPGYAPSADSSLKVLHRDVVRAADSAVDKALKAMRTPIDREFKPEAAPEE